MDDEIPEFKTPESYEQFAINVQERSPERAAEARRRAVRLRAKLLGAETAAEQECLEAIFAYEWTLYKKHGKRQKAAYTWRMLKQRGIIAAVEHTATRKQETEGYRALVSEGMQEMAFEAVVLRHPDVFSAEAIAQSRARLAEWQAGDARA
jgi:hypothetical protein